MILKRISYTEHGTFGVLIQNNIPFAVTLERPWIENRINISCIPTGLYVCKRVKSPRFGNTFEVTDVPGRTSILFHKGNLQENSHGCILIGEQYEFLNDQPAVLASKKGFGEFLFKTSTSDEFKLLICL